MILMLWFLTMSKNYEQGYKTDLETREPRIRKSAGIIAGVALTTILSVQPTVMEGIPLCDPHAMTWHEQPGNEFPGMIINIGEPLCPSDYK